MYNFSSQLPTMPSWGIAISLYFFYLLPLLAIQKLRNESKKGGTAIEKEIIV